MLHVPHSSYYYQPHTDPEKQRIDQNVKDEIVDIYMEKPFFGIRRITAELQQKGYKVNHKRVRRLRKATGLRTVYPRPRFSTSEPHPDHEVYPYLLKDLKIDHSNQVWATDITYTKVSGCKAFVIAIIDLYSRKTLAYNVVNTMDTYSCVETLLLAMTRYGIPEISIRIRAASSPARSSRMNSRRMASESAWMAGADAGTMPGWNGSGGR